MNAINNIIKSIGQNTIVYNPRDAANGLEAIVLERDGKFKIFCVDTDANEVFQIIETTNYARASKLAESFVYGLSVTVNPELVTIYV